MKNTKEKLIQIQEKLNDLIDSDATQEEAIWSVKKYCPTLKLIFNLI